MNFPTKLTIAGIVLALFALGFGYYQAHHPWPSPLPMYPCLLVVALAGFFLYATPDRH